MSKLYRSLLWSGLVVAGVAACGDDVTITPPPPPPPPPPPTVHSVSVGPTGVTIQSGTSLQMIASVNADAGVATTVAWNINVASGVASITPSGGLLTTIVGQAAQIAVQACSTVNPSVCGNATVSVVNAPVPTPTQVIVTPGVSNVNRPLVGAAGDATVQLSAAVLGLNNPGQGVNWTVVGAPVVGVSVSAAGLVTMTSASAVNSVNISACSSLAGFGNICGFATINISTLPSAQISINAINNGGTVVPVNINNVMGQIDALLNFNPNGRQIDSVRIQLLRAGSNPPFRTAAKQNFGGVVPAAGILTLSVNTANFTITRATGAARVDWYNGPTTLQAQVFMTTSGVGGAIDCQIAANDPTCATPQALVFNNADGWAGEIVKCSLVNTNTGTTPNSGGPIPASCPAAAPVAPVTSGVFTNSTGGFATDAGGAAANIGNTYWGGPGATGATFAQIYPIVYNNNPAFASGSALNRCSNLLGDGTGCITTVTWNLATPAGLAPFPATDGGCAGVVQGPALPFARSWGTAGASACAYQNTIATRNNIVITAAIDGVNNPYPLVGASPAAGIAPTTLIPNATVFGATPDSLRLDYVGPAVTGPTVIGSEVFFWVNAAWAFNPGGTVVADAGVGATGTNGTWANFVSLNGGGGGFPTGPAATGAALAETNQNCTGAGCDGYVARASAVDRLGNGANSATSAAFGDDQTSPLMRYSTAAGGSVAPLPSIYLGNGASSGALANMDSTLVSPAGAAIQALPAPAAGDSIRTESIDNRSGLSRMVVTSRRFAQGGATGLTTALGCATTVGAFGASFFDGWRPGPQVHYSCGSALPGYYTTAFQAVDRAGNVSGVFTSAPSVAGGSNPAVPGAQNANLYFRRIVVLDPGQPAITGVSPNNAYTGNSSQTWSLGSQDDLEVIDAKLRINYPNITIGDAAGTIQPLPGLVWSYALSNAFMAAGNAAGTASGTGANFGFFPPIATRWDASIVNPQITSLTQDLFTINVQETCTAAGALPAGASTGPTAGCTGGPAAVGDPIPTGSIPLAIPTALGVQVRDVFGSWIFNTIPGAITGVAPEFVTPILPATVAAPGSYAVAYSVLAPGCPRGGGAPGGTCVTGGVNWRSDPGGSAAVKPFRAVEPLSVTLPIWTRVELYALKVVVGDTNWVFIQRCTVPGVVPPFGVTACTGGGGTITGSDNGLERYWVFTFTGVPALPVAAFGAAPTFRALGVNAAGFGLFSSRQ